MQNTPIGTSLFTRRVQVQSNTMIKRYWHSKVLFHVESVDSNFQRQSRSTNKHVSSFIRRVWIEIGYICYISRCPFATLHMERWVEMRLAHRSATGLWIFFPAIHRGRPSAGFYNRGSRGGFFIGIFLRKFYGKEKSTLRNYFSRRALFWPVCTLIRAPCFITIHAWPFLFPIQGRMIEVFL